MLRMQQLQRITETVKKAKYIVLEFTDLVGNIRGRTVPSSFAQKAFEEGLGFDGSSILGFTKIEESDLVMKGDPSTLSPLPDYIYGRPTATAICDILDSEGKPFKGDPRHICRRQMEKILDEGYMPYAAAEVEFYLVKNSNGSFESVENHVANSHRYFDLTPGADLTEQYRMDLCDALSFMGITIEREGHEVGPAQNEITFKYADPIKTADNILYYRFVAKAVAKQKYDWIATFMPKPWDGKAGNGMHVHLSLFTKDGERNVFYDSEGYAGISQTCRYFIGGLLYHARALCAVVAPTVNSYKRLVPGYEAPVYIAWSRKNRSALIRVPEYFIGNGKRKRIEFRSPDPLCNPYLAYAVIFEAGMDGVRRKIEPGDPIEKNVYHLTEAERRSLGIGILPASLKEALEEWESDDICIQALGKETAEKYLKLKLAEWQEYEKNGNANTVTAWEIQKYLYM